MNHLEILRKDIFVNVTKLSTLLLYKNNFKALYSQTKEDFNIQLVVASTFAVCCLFSKETQCNISKSWLTSCSEVISKIHLKILFVFVMVFIIVFNLESFSMNFVNRERMAFTIIVLYIHSFDIICGLYFLLFNAMNFHHGTNFVFNLSFSGSLFCHTMFSCITIYSILSPMILLFSSVARLMVVLYPLLSRFRLNSFVANLLGLSTGCTVLLLWIVFLLLRFDWNFHTNPLCIPLVTREILSLGEVVRIILCIFQVLSIISVLGVYIVLVNHLIKNPSPSTNQSKRLITTVRRISIEFLCDFSCWVPSNIIFCQLHTSLKTLMI